MSPTSSSTCVALRGGILAAMLLALCACSPYHLRGLVVAGDSAAVVAVGQNDSRLASEGLADAVIELTLDPSSMRPQQIGMAVTDAQGRFDIPIEALGAGFMEYQLGLLCNRDGYQQVWEIVPMPPTKRQLIVTMVQGRGAPQRAPDILQETLELKDQLME